MRQPHPTVPVQVWVDVDEGVAEVVRFLNRQPGVRTFSSCQGTLGEGGPAPYPAYVQVGWADHDAWDWLNERYLLIGPEIGATGMHLAPTYDDGSATIEVVAQV